MNIGVITLVGDNYGNKFQNYAVEQLLKPYGTVMTYALQEYSVVTIGSSFVGSLAKLKPSYIKDVARARLMYSYDITDMSKGLIRLALYSQLKKSRLHALRDERSIVFKAFSDEHLHIAPQKITRENARGQWLSGVDVFAIGSDQIWNPNYPTTSELAFAPFARNNAFSLSASFGVASIPESKKDMYREGLEGLSSISVREKVGVEIVKRLTGRSAEVLLDPTMAIPADEWRMLSAKPKAKLPKRYLACYFLGSISKERRAYIEKTAKARGLKIVELFNILKPEYYVFGPQEVLYVLDHAEAVITDSFHGTVFSILFGKEFQVLFRDEGGASISSRIETLLEKFNAEQGESFVSVVSPDAVLASERHKTLSFIKQAM